MHCFPPTRKDSTFLFDRNKRRKRRRTSKKKNKTGTWSESNLSFIHFHLALSRSDLLYFWFNFLCKTVEQRLKWPKRRNEEKSSVGFYILYSLSLSFYHQLANSPPLEFSHGPPRPNLQERTKTSKIRAECCSSSTTRAPFLHSKPLTTWPIYSLDVIYKLPPIFPWLFIFFYISFICVKYPFFFYLFTPRYYPSFPFLLINGER